MKTRSWKTASWCWSKIQLVGGQRGFQKKINIPLAEYWITISKGFEVARSKRHAIAPFRLKEGKKQKSGNNRRNENSEKGFCEIEGYCSNMRTAAIVCIAHSASICQRWRCTKNPCSHNICLQLVSVNKPWHVLKCNMRNRRNLQSYMSKVVPPELLWLRCITWKWWSPVSD